MTQRDDLLDQFLIEGRELVERAAADLAVLERRADDREGLDGLFRTVHTLKGSAALFELPALTALLHAAETALEAARREGGSAPELRAATARVLDITEAWLDALEADAPVEQLGEETARVLASLTGSSAEAPSHDEAAPAADWARALTQGLGLSGPVVAIRYTPAAEAYYRGEDPLAVVRAIPGLAKVGMAAAPDDGAYDPFRCSLRLQAISTAPVADVRQALRLVADHAEIVVVEAFEPAPAGAPGLALRSLRIDAGRLDELAELMDELVIAKNALFHEARHLAAASGGGGRGLANAQAAVERLVSDLHASVTTMRLVRLSHVFTRFPRQVREISEALGKDVELLISGEQVTVDKAVAERLFEPLLHLVRNALDHGVEAPEARVAAGKRRRALLTIAAQARGDEVTIDVSDDGRGIDADRVRRAAIERGALAPEAAEALTDSAAVELVFTAGLSTTEAVSDLSGRGVGMDAVHAAVHQLGGRVALDSRPGEGLAVRLTLPAHVVLTKILVVEAGEARFGVPLDSVAETHRVRLDEVTRVRAGRAYVRRDTVIPLVRLSDLLGVGADEGEVFPVLSVEARGELVGVQIERIAERVEAPLRPMSGLMAAFPGVVGTVLQGDGQVLLVLDLAELAA